MSCFKAKSPLLPNSSSGQPSARGGAISPVPARAGGKPRTAQSSQSAKNNTTPLPKRNEVMIMHTSSFSGIGNRISPIPMQEKARVAHGEHIKGGIKAPPVCVALSLKREASSAEELASESVRFSQVEAASRAEKALLLLREREVDPGGEMSPKACADKNEAAAFVSSNGTVVTISSASSCGQVTMAGRGTAGEAAAVRTDRLPLEVVRTVSTVSLEDELVAGGGECASAAIFADGPVGMNLSRQGRSLQRWLVRPSTGELVRRAAGTVPITRDGRIVLISAGRKAEWILPKGGWDVDETMEECAIRETFEEAGLLGRLGGAAGPLDYETKKARTRGLSGAGESDGDGAGDGRPERGDDGPRAAKRVRPGPTAASLPPTERLVEVPGALACSVDAKSCSRVRLHLFPLYVTDVRSDWPEGGRLRRMVDVDEAIEIMTRQGRPYFRRGLEIVKDRGLHLPRP